MNKFILIKFNITTNKIKNLPNTPKLNKNNTFSINQKISILYKQSLYHHHHKKLHLITILKLKI